MKTKLTIRPATVDDQDFIIGLVPRFVEFSCPPGREPIFGNRCDRTGNISKWH